MASNWLFLIFASYGVPSPSISNRMAAGHPMARYSATFVIQLRKPNSVKLDLLPKAPIESFWDALWLGIQPFL